MIWMWDAVCGGLDSLNHDVTTSLGLIHAPILQKSIPNYRVRVHPYAHPQHIKVLKHIVYK